jgi:predicted ATPase
MAVSDEVRLLEKKWANGGGTGWPKRLEWMEINGLRGWTGQRLSLSFPIVAIVGENGSGKSALLQAAACVYRPNDEKNTLYPSEFFPDTAWDQITDSTIEYGYMQGDSHSHGSLRKPTTRWLGHGERPVREVEYIDLNRIQPLATRVGYARIAKTKHEQKSATAFKDQQVKHLSGVMGRDYRSARMAISSIDAGREVPVVGRGSTEYSGFHQGSGEMTVIELLQVDLPKYGLILIDEIESSLHPRAQRRLVRYLAEQCREREIQIVLTTHSPYILEELPLSARIYILETEEIKRIVPGVSPQFAMTKMDDEVHPECDLYVEDVAAKVFLGEILARFGMELFTRCTIVPFGAASVGYALGQMASNKRFTRPSCVFLDGDNSEAPGCIILPGGDAPEQVVFKILREKKWGNLWTRIARDISRVSDACTRAMTLGDHHEWVRYSANELMCGGDILWQAMCAEWASFLSSDDAAKIVLPIEEVLS